MAIVKFPRNKIEKHFRLTPQILDKINMFGTPVESLDSENLEIEVFANRPDLITMHGFIRAFKAFTGKETGLKKYEIKKPAKNYTVKVNKNVKTVRPNIACAIVKNLALDEEKIKELVNVQEKLHSTVGRNRKKLALGLYPLDKIRLPIRYEARDPSEIKFVPLGGLKEMTGTQILKKHAAGREYSHLLEEHKKFPVFVDSAKRILSMPPIINNIETGKITEETRDIFVECSGHHLPTLSKTLNVLVTALSDMGGEIYGMHIKDSPKRTSPDFSTEKRKVLIADINRLLGLRIKEGEIKKLLERMGYEYNAKSKTVSIPPWRSDILHEVDIAEDIAIAYGYERITPEISHFASVAEESGKHRINTKISEMLTGLGLLEISSYHLIKKQESKKMGVPEEEMIELENSKTDYKILRQSLLAPLLRALGENKNSEYPQNLFEIGKTFSHDRKAGKINEHEKLIIGLSPGNFTGAKQHLDYLFKMLDMAYSLKREEKNLLVSGRTGNIIVNGKEIGYIGEIHPKTLKSWNLRMPLSVIEISLAEIYARLDAQS